VQHLIAPAGNIALRVIATMPSTWGVFKLDQLVASVARETLWVTDAYFVGVTAYVNALIAAARDGVDVRLLVPGTVDVFGVGAMSRAGYRALLEGGVRIFEWNGVMLHAKTAVADGRWARVGSTNANINSWWGNWELDVAIEDEDFARQMMAMFENDLANSTEVVLTARRMHSVHSVERRRGRRLDEWKAHGRSTRRAAAAGAIRMGRTFGAVLTARREVGAAEAYSLFWTSLIFLAIGAVALWWPKAIAYPFGVLGVWLAVVGLYRAGKLYYQHRREVQKAPERREPERQERVV
jgi:cardiolipin synthase